MASPQESEILTRVGPGTAMGELMRQYWLPAAASRELVAGGAPMRLMLLGEKLIAFRDAAGRVGVMDHRCPHRCASLFYGRNEEGGLRCVYHGWKFDVAGNCLEMPNVPPEYDYRDKVEAKSYPATERNGLIWVYMGPRAEPPALPALEPALLPAKEMMTFLCQRECNWLQGMEGDIDTSHFSFLHAGTINADDIPAGNMARHALVNRSPSLSVAKTEWGTVYGARRISDGRIYWRFAPFAFPFWTMPPEGDFDKHLIVRAWVPMDDTHTMFVSLTWKQMSRTPPLKDGKPIPGAVPVLEYQPNSTDWYGRWRPAANAANDYQIDREAQRNDVIYTGISYIHMQDQAITESMGEIVDHSFEHLAPSDQMITRTRRRLLLAARALRDKAVVPPGVDDPGIYMQARSGEAVLAAEDWQEAYRDRLRHVVRPTGWREAAD
jgi:phthalate 4,5-dioxygenase oxygenase subunit